MIKSHFIEILVILQLQHNQATNTSKKYTEEDNIVNPLVTGKRWWFGKVNKCQDCLAMGFMGYGGITKTIFVLDSRCWLEVADNQVSSGRMDAAKELLTKVLTHNNSCAAAYQYLGNYSFIWGIRILLCYQKLIFQNFDNLCMTFCVRKPSEALFRNRWKWYSLSHC